MSKGFPLKVSCVRRCSASEGFHVPGVPCLSGFSVQGGSVSKGFLCLGGSQAPRGSASGAVPASEKSWVPSTGGNGSGAHQLPGLPAAAAPALLPAEHRHPPAVSLDGTPGLLRLGWRAAGAAPRAPPIPPPPQICLMIGMAHVLVVYRVLAAALFSSALPVLGEQVTTAVVVSGALVHYVTILIMTKVGVAQRRTQGQGAALPRSEASPVSPPADQQTCGPEAL